MKHLYVHIPFCRSRCAYCDFASEPARPHARAGRVGEYVEALRAEVDERLGAGAPGGAAGGAAGAGGGNLETIFIGGGTPTVLPHDLLVELVRDLAGRLAAPGSGATDPASSAAAAEAACGGAPAGGRPAEFTIEANPGTIDEALLGRLAEAGVTRLSLGIQSFAPALRAALGRRVAQREIEASLGAISATGWREWNVDLVFGIPGQTWSAAAADIDAAVAAGPTHISMYDLTYTPAYLAHLEAARRSAPPAAAGAAGAGTGLHVAESAASESGAPAAVSSAPGLSAGAPAALVGAAPPSGPADWSPDDPEASFAETYFADAVARLEAGGYRRYEVSNFALPGHECRHNQAYWRGEDYLGVGASAVSTIDGERRTNPRSVAGYLRGDGAEVEFLPPDTRLWEKAMLGLRTMEGVDEQEVSAVLDSAARERLLEQGCLERRCGRMRLNRGVLDVSNAIISALLVRPGGSEASRQA